MLHQELIQIYHPGKSKRFQINEGMNSVEYIEACKRLVNHASLPNSEPEAESLGFALWRLSEGEDFAGRLDLLFVDVIKCFDVINIKINGEPPSGVPNLGKDDTVDRWVVYSVNCILESQLEAIRSPYASHLQEFLLEMLAGLIAGWNCVLAGDVDDIQFEIEASRRAKRGSDQNLDKGKP